MNIKPSFEFIIEILRQKSNATKDDLKLIALEYLQLAKPSKALVKLKNTEIFSQVEEITINEVIQFPLDFNQISNCKVFVYSVSENGPEIETLEDNDGGSEDVPASHHWILPNREFQGLWENLIYEYGLKENILKFAKTIILFSQKGIDSNVISCNKLVLLHGPPGTGKTSLCKALAQKLSIQMQDIFSYTHFFEINSHSLFSKWFSESGKLVLKLFSNIKSVAEHKKSLVIILIDEVESIVYARDSVSSNEPSDSLRVVNAVLTQLDQLRHLPNILVLTTSNLTSTIDLAFVDRADLKQFVGHPTVEAIYEIFCGAIEELMNVEIIFPKIELVNYQTLQLSMEEETDGNKECRSLFKLARKCDGFSGRTLRKLPLMAHAWFINVDQINLESFLEAFDLAIEKYLIDLKNIHH